MTNDKIDRVADYIAIVFCVAVSVLLAWPLIIHYIR